ncbi:SDR family NAD(P)-dependent oxidoreductase [Lacticaseibacillus hulanensis]|uniref:SDR family NAD(P)-dependent oxidoreductase n=1 Tax=Lacticaseibacillus hulanensis TaxID=2493111 RepID=UPI000FD6F5EB|nr:SDR family oxidoreductase [Lacticaseibacillus hulanensis]
MTNNLTGQVVVITGGSSGIGKAVALQAASAGATVVVTARNTDKLNDVRVAAQARSHRPAFAFKLDVSDPVNIDAAWADLMATVPRVDVLVNAAGFGDFELALDTPMHVTEKMFRTNVLGLIYMSRLAGRQMLRQGGGHIINIGSMAGKIATPKSAVYAATKSAVIAYSNALRLELRPSGINVTTVNPGPVATDFFKTAHALDYAQAVAVFTLNPEKLAARIVSAFGHPVREINAPMIMNLGALAYPLVPRVGDWLAGTIFNRK